MAKRTYADTKVVVGLIVILGYIVFAAIGVLFLILGAISELDLTIIASPFVAFAPAAKIMFDTLAFGEKDVLLYQFSDQQLVTFFDALYNEIEHSIDRRDCIVINAKDFFRLHQDILFDINSQEEHLKYFPGPILKRYEGLFLRQSQKYKGVISGELFDYFVKKIFDWSQSNPMQSPNRTVSKTAFRLILFAAIAHPLVGVALLWLRAFGLLSVDAQGLATVSAIASTIFAGFWTSTMSKFGAGNDG